MSIPGKAGNLHFVSTVGIGKCGVQFHNLKCKMIWRCDSCIQLALQFSSIIEVIGYMNFKSEGDCQCAKDEPVKQTTQRIEQLILFGYPSG